MTAEELYNKATDILLEACLIEDMVTGNYVHWREMVVNVPYLIKQLDSKDE